MPGDDDPPKDDDPAKREYDYSSEAQPFGKGLAKAVEQARQVLRDRGLSELQIDEELQRMPGEEEKDAEWP